MQSESREIVDADDKPHEHGAETGWTERISFNFFDEARACGGIATLEYSPSDRKANGVVDLFLPGGAVATVLARAQNTKRADLTVGRIAFTCDEQMKRWSIRCKDIALVFPTAASSNLSTASERHGAASQVDISLSFEAWTPPVGWAARRTEVDEQRFASIVSIGSFEQAGSFRGSLKAASMTAEFDGHGFRERVWGARKANGWLAVAFSPALVVSAGSVTVSGDEVARDWTRKELEAPARADVSATANTARIGDVELSMERLSTIPPRAGEDGLARAMTLFKTGGREALGLLETPSENA